MRTDGPRQPPAGCSGAVAIIGLAGRFPGAPDLDTFWRNLADGVESVTEFSEEEILASGVDPALVADPNYVRKGVVLEGADLFDAEFFGFNPLEAQVIDPQQRVFLECAWEALENAGYAADTERGAVGVFAGVGMNTYLFSNLLANRAALEAVGPYQLMLASDKDFLSTRVCYKLNLTGPGVTVQTACSTSLVAVQMACQSLLAGQCDVALAGGVSIPFPQRSGYLFSEGMILSPDGHCRPFDEQARGTRPGAGAAIVVLKLLTRALADGDTIRAVIRGAAVNNDGAGKMGYSAPSVEGQARAIEAAQAQAGMDPDSISYVEAHGTATPLGDPIEIAALDRVFGARTSRRGFCAIGSVKSNIGHLDAAAGVAGLIKTVLALEHQAIPPSLHFHKPNPQIDFAESAFFVNSQLREWKPSEAPRRAGVSSFGIGGTNAHVVLEEAPARTLTVASRPCQVLVLSARTSTALDSSASTLGRFLREHPEVDLANAAYTLQVGRARFTHRRALVCQGRDEAIAALEARPTRAIASVEEALSRPVAFLFSGQGSQHPGMAAGLYREEPQFREWLDRIAAILRPHLGCDLTGLLYPAPGQEEEAAARLTDTRFAQPALFAVEYALARMWMSWGIAPDAMLGHSIGEYVAACLAGVFSLEDALAVVAARGRLMQDAAPGAMLAVFQPAARLTEWLTGGVSLAAENTPSLCTLSGPHPAIRAVEESLQARRVNCRRLHTSHAFHSEMMDPVLKAFREVVSQIRLAEPSLPFVSNVTGTWVRPEEATDPNYWARHLRQTVRFADGLRQLLQDPRRILLEVGPGQVLTTFARETSRLYGGREALPSLPHPQQPQPELPFVLETLGRLWTSGSAVDWQGFHRGETLHRVPLPGYPFERKSYWVEPKVSSGPPSRSAKKPDIADWFYVPSWKRSVAPSLPTGDAPEPCSWLVFLDEGGLGQEILNELSARGEACVGVVPGQKFARLGSGLCSIDPASKLDYELLLRALEATGQTPQSVLHLWNVTHGAAGETPRWASFYSLLHLAQAWDDVQQGRALTLTIVSDGLHAVNASDSVEPDKALLLGPCKVIPQEYPAIQCRSVDLAPSKDGGLSPVRDLLLEPRLFPGEQVVAYRSGRRWEQTYEPLRLEAAWDAHGSRLRERGVYLITGGLGGVGLALARYLAESFHARLVLTARSPLPPPAEWDRWLSANGDGDRISEKIQKIRELEQLGGEVAVFAADVADPAGMRDVFEQSRARFGPFHGVIHAAGVAGAGMIGTKTREMAESVFSPKVSGTAVLAALLEKEAPDFLLLCSSVDAIQGAFGAVDYCSANAFLDAYSAAHPGVVSVNWDTWQEVGMAVNTEVPADLRAARLATLRHGIKPSEGVEAFRRLLAAALPQVAVVTRDLPAILAEARQPRRAEAADRAAAGTGGAETGHPRPELSNSFAAPENECQCKLVEIWKGQLGIDQIGIDDNFFELGGHSLLATGVLSRLRKSFDVTIPLRAIFEYPTVRMLAAAVMDAQASTASQNPEEHEGREVIEL